MPAAYRRVGRIQRSHGTQGEVVVAIGDGLSFDDLRGLDVWVVPPSVRVRSYRILDVRPGPRGAIVTLEDVEAVAVAREITGRWLLAEAASLPGPDAAATDMIGYAVSDVLRGHLGVVTDIIVTGANDVLVVDEGPFGQVLLPVIEQVILDVDDSARSLSVALLDGLIDEEDDA